MEENLEVSLADESRIPSSSRFARRLGLARSGSTLYCELIEPLLVAIAQHYGAAGLVVWGGGGPIQGIGLGGSLDSLCSAQVRIMSRSMTKERLGAISAA